MDTPNIIDATFLTIQEAFTKSASMFLFLLIGAGIGIAVLIHNVRQVPRLDPTRHLERPPIEPKAPRSLPPAEEFVKWEAQQDKQKEGVPWEEN